MRNVLVTGGSRGIGLGIAQALTASGFKVVAVARSDNDTFATVREQIKRQGTGELHFRALDLSDLERIPPFIKALRGEFGPLYGLVNNAGRGGSGILANMQDDRIQELVAMNVMSPLILSKYVARSMMAGHGGRIVNIASIVAATGYSGLSVYSATKAALIGFTRSLARELGPLGITVNAVAPGFVDTEMTHDMKPEQRAQIARRSALLRLPEIGDIANAVDFLFSDKARNISGTVTTIDAGNTA